MTYGSQAAAASEVFAQQRDLALRDKSGKGLELVDAALARLDAGTFGAVPACGDPIPDGAPRGPALGGVLRRCQRSRTAEMSERRPMPRTGVALVGLDEIRAAAETLARRRPADAARWPFGPAGRNEYLKAESLQPIGAFKIRGAYDAIAGARPGDPGSRRDHLLAAATTPRASPGRRACSASRRLIVMPSDAPAGQARRGSSRRRGRGRDRRAVERGAPAASPRSSPPSAACRSSRPSTTTGSSPARAPSGWRSPRTCPTSRLSSSRSAAAAWRPASRRRSGRSARAPG